MDLPKVEAIVFCEDIRFETSGKQILLGVAAPELNAKGFPVALQIAVWASVQPKTTGDLVAKFRLVNSKKNPIIIGDFRASFPLIAKGALVFGPFPVHLPGPEEIHMEWSLTGMKWSRVGTLKIGAPPPA